MNELDAEPESDTENGEINDDYLTSNKGGNHSAMDDININILQELEEDM